MKKRCSIRPWILVPVILLGVGLVAGLSSFSPEAKVAAKEAPSSYAPVKITEPFADTRARMQGEKAEIMKRQMELLEKRYDLGDHPAAGVTMTRGKPVQEGVRVKLPAATTWEKLAN